MGLDEAYKVLGVESSVSIEEVCKVENSLIYIWREKHSLCLLFCLFLPRRPCLIVDGFFLVRQKAKTMMEANEKAGSFYLQSKVYRAQEAIENSYRNAGNNTSEQEES